MRSLRFTAVLIILAVMCIFSVNTQAQPAKANQIKVLLISGDDVAPYHDWKEISEKTREALVEAGKFDVRICEDPLILESKKALSNYDIVLITMFNSKLPTITDQAKENLENFVSSGKGFYVQHLASASFREWDAYKKMCGRYWVMGTSGHSPRSVFKCKIENTEHPITKGMSDFRIFDELYSKLQGEKEIEVLVSAYSDFSKTTEPLVFTTKFGKGKCVHNALGHDFKAILNPAMKKLICNSVEWAATGKVTE